MLASLLLAMVTPVANGQETYTLNDYANECAGLIAEAPAFNCLDLEIIPTTVNGKVPENYTPKMACDKPAMLPYPEETDGQCTPYSRVKVHRDDDIQMILFCRRMYIRPADDPNFDSMEIIMHNVKSGSTCFFISKNFGEDPNGNDGTRVPPPHEVEPPEGQISAEELWATPQQVADHGCIYCHDSDPWMRTPWIDQIGELPADPWGFHSVDVGGPFKTWPKPQSIRTRGNTCVGCHRIGSLNTCQHLEIPTFGHQPAKMLQSVGQAPHGRLGARYGTIDEDPPDPFSALTKSYPHSYWMPLGNELPFTEWNLIYEHSVAELQRCCADHDAPGCEVAPIEGRADWLKRMSRQKDQ
ncbi:hypothetical protein [Nitratireductor sp. XY-223]|uniref:hypothetical protein n=1 Tax=Nitratireductor sp. XY-223 TaxID=2561926 RepID=UPI0010AA3A96|nr:hypothetical protein [Nitratireductor sp. XY-223]